MTTFVLLLPVTHVVTLTKIQQLGDCLGKGAFGQVYRELGVNCITYMGLMMGGRCFELGYGRDGSCERDRVSKYPQERVGRDYGA